MFNATALTSLSSIGQFAEQALQAIEQLHFIRPWVGLLIIPALILFVAHLSKGQHKQGWAQLVDEHLLQWLMPNANQQKTSKLTPWLLMVFWLLAVLALSGPSWKQLPQPLFTSQAARVLVLDLSMSMDATDVSPSRLERAQFKVRDLLAENDDGQTALVVYAGDAYTLSPLTDDGDTIENLLMALRTDLMPLMGSKPETGIEKAIELLDNAQVPMGTIIWITDGAEPESLELMEDLLSDSRYNLKMLAVGTEQGSPIKLQGGAGFLKDNRGEIVVPKLHYNRLADFANSIEATLTPVTTDNTDIELLLEQEDLSFEEQMEEQDMFADSWEDSGFWFIVLLLPILLYAFKQPKIFGVIALAMLINGISLTTNTTALHATETSANTKPVTKKSLALVEDLKNAFLNSDQQGKALLDNGDPEKAYDTFDNKNWKAVSAYRNGDFNRAQTGFTEGNTGLSDAEALYNRGNAQVMNGEYDAAIESYEKALTYDKDFSDAADNLSIANALKERKEQQEKEQDEESEEQQQESQEQQEEAEQESEEQQDSEQEQESQEESEKKVQKEQDREFKEEEKDQELEQWLRRISDDPGGLLRRKMYQEYRRRGVNHKVDKTW